MFRMLEAVGVWLSLVGSVVLHGKHQKKMTGYTLWRSSITSQPPEILLSEKTLLIETFGKESRSSSSQCTFSIFHRSNLPSKEARAEGNWHKHVAFPTTVLNHIYSRATSVAGPR